MKTLLPNKDFEIVNGEINIYDIIPIISGEGGTLAKKVLTHSTASLQGVKQLDRSLFVKGMDVEELAKINCPIFNIPFTRE